MSGAVVALNFNHTQRKGEKYEFCSNHYIR